MTANHSHQLVKPIFSTIYANRELIQTFAFRDLIVKYRNSLLGYFWAVIPQIATALLFTLLASRRVFNMGQTELPYLIHVLWSISLWQLFASTIMNSQNSLKLSGNLILKVNFEKVTIVIASIVPSILDFIIRLLPIIIACAWYSYAPGLTVFLLPVIIVFVVMMALGIGLLLSGVNLVISDFGNAVSVLLTFGMFMSPIFYPPPTSGLFVYVNTINPFSPLLIASQKFFAGTPLDNIAPLSFSILIAFGVFIIGWRFFYVAIPRIVERA